VQQGRVDFTVAPEQGDVSVVPAQRTYHLIFHRVTRPAVVILKVNGASREAMTLYDEDLQRHTIEVIAAPRERVEIIVQHGGAAWLAQDDRRERRFRQMLRTFRMESDTKREIDERLADVFADPTALKSLGITVKDGHSAALHSVIDCERL
jgi:protease II